MIELEAIGRKASGNRIVTDAPYILIGRSPASNFIVPDPRVSWHHGEVVFRDNEYLYFDLRSTHGSMLRRGDTDRAVQAARLREGDVILLAGRKNGLRVNHIARDEAVRDDVAITISDGIMGPGAVAEELFVDDAAALRAFLALERALVRGDETGRNGMLQALIECLKDLYPELDYAAVLEERDGELILEQSLTIMKEAYPRKSAHIRAKARESRDGFTFDIAGKQIYARHGASPEELSAQSATIEHDTTGICVPINLGRDCRLFVQMERAAHHDKFSNRDLVLVRAMVFRTEDRMRHLDISKRYYAASQNASLGIFAQTLAHDIKNALAFAPYLNEKLADETKHPDVIRGVETAYQLARCLQSPSRSDARTMGSFSLAQLSETITKSFASLFEGRCRFETICDTEQEKIVGYGHLLYRTIWNLVMNAYNAHENVEGVPREERYIKLHITQGSGGISIVRIEDNAGGMGEDLLLFFQKSFDMIRDACDTEIDILNVVEMMKTQEGAVNRVGLFFTAIAVNDMHGKLSVDSKAGVGTTFQIALPRKIERLRGLLQF